MKTNLFKTLAAVAATACLTLPPAVFAQTSGSSSGPGGPQNQQRRWQGGGPDWNGGGPGNAWGPRQNFNQGGPGNGWGQRGFNRGGQQYGGQRQNFNQGGPGNGWGQRGFNRGGQQYARRQQNFNRGGPGNGWGPRGYYNGGGQQYGGPRRNFGQGGPGNGPQQRQPGGGFQQQNQPGGNPLENVAANLNLTDAQKAKVQPIIDQTRPQLQAIRQDAMSKSKAVILTSLDQIKPLLTTDQAQKLGQMQQRLNAPATPLQGNPAPAPPPN